MVQWSFGIFLGHDCHSNTDLGCIKGCIGAHMPIRDRSLWLCWRISLSVMDPSCSRRSWICLPSPSVGSCRRIAVKVLEIFSCRNRSTWQLVHSSSGFLTYSFASSEIVLGLFQMDIAVIVMDCRHDLELRGFRFFDHLDHEFSEILFEKIIILKRIATIANVFEMSE